MAIKARSKEEGTEERVKPLELFFDLIFVFALTQVTSLVSDQPTWEGLAQGTVVLGVIWWAWAAYAWLTNTIDPDEGYVRLAMFGAMGAMLVVSLAVPGSFADNAVLFVVAYGLVRVAHLALYVIAGWGDRELLAAVVRLGAGSVAGIALLFVASTLDGWPQVALWAAAISVDMLGAYIGGGRGWQAISASHFAERYGLVLIIALGESIVAVGVSAPAQLDTGVIAAALLGLVVAAGLWWAYFDVVAIVAERKLGEASGSAQLTMARDSYSYLHLPLVLGIVLFAVGVKKTLAHVGDPLKPVPAVCLCCGIALYLLAHVGFRLRNVGSLNRQRLVVAAVLVLMTPFALELPALASLAIVAGLVVALIVFEALVFAEARERVRHAA